MRINPSLYFTGYKMNILVRNNTVLNAMTVHEPLYKSVYSGFGKSIVRGKANLFLKKVESIYLSKNIMLPLP